MVLPAGFEVPPLPYAAAVVAVSALVGWRLNAERPPVTERTVLALSPWMVLGAAAYACHQLEVVPGLLAPLASSPLVYLATFVLAGAVWLAARHVRERPLVHLALAGSVLLTVPIGAAVWTGASRGTLALAWPVGGAVAAGVLAAVVWTFLTRLRPSTAVTGWVGALAVFGHTLDGVSTAVGIDVLGFGEQTPLSRAIIEVGGALPTAPYVGGAWLFVVVKVLLATLVVWLFADYVRSDPGEGYLLLGIVAAVGLGPGVHNIVLFAASGG